MNKLLWALFILCAISIGLYPVMYALIDWKYAFPGSKPAELQTDIIWRLAFVAHISFGGIAMLSGWSQFSKKLRAKKLSLHRTLGKIYLICISLSGVAGLYLALFANGGLISSFGFGGLAIGWLLTSSIAYRAIKKGDIDDHERWMIRSYALCFAAVTLRIWLPISQAVLHLDFIEAYRVIAWLCWVPNLLFAEWWISKMKKPSPRMA